MVAAARQHLFARRTEQSIPRDKPQWPRGGPLLLIGVVLVFHTAARSVEMANPKNPVDRRAMLAGAGAVGALAAVASLLPAGPAATPVVKAAGALPASDTAAGYRLTEHVQQYYRSARI